MQASTSKQFALSHSQWEESRPVTYSLSYIAQISASGSFNAIDTLCAFLVFKAIGLSDGSEKMRRVKKLTILVAIVGWGTIYGHHISTRRILRAGSTSTTCQG